MIRKTLGNNKICYFDDKSTVEINKSEGYIEFVHRVEDKVVERARFNEIIMKALVQEALIMLKEDRVV